MGIGNGYLVLSIIIGFSFLALGSGGNVYAIDTILSDEDSCTDPPLGGVWMTPTCTLSSSLIINAGDTLTITDGVTLKLPIDATFLNQGGTITNNGIITLEGNAGINKGILSNQNDAVFTNSGTITITGTSDDQGQLRNQIDSVFTNSGTITIKGTTDDSGRLTNNNAVFTNSGTIIITGTSGDSGQLLNQINSNFINSGIVTITGTSGDSGQIVNQNNGLIFNDCGGEITFVSITGNPIKDEPEINCIFGTSNAYEDPTIGKSNAGKQVVENGICIDITCWTVTAHYHQDFELVEMLTGSTHTITTTIFCNHGVNKCNYAAFGVSPYGTNINDSVWKIILQKDHLDNWTMKVLDPNGYLGEVISTTQKIIDGKYLSVSVTIEFKKSTPGMILNIEVRDSGGGYRDFKFNDGISIIDAYEYPLIQTSYEHPLEVTSLCLNENSNKRYTCAFDKVRDWTIKNAEAALEQIN